MADNTGNDARPDTVSALERGIAVLRCFDEDRRVLSPTELSRLTGIPRPTVTRLELVAHGPRQGSAGSVDLFGPLP